MNSPTKTQTLTIEAEEADMRLDKWLLRKFPTLAKAHIQKIIRTGQVRLDGKRVEAAARITQGANVRIPPLQLGEPPAPGRPPITESKRAAHRKEIEEMILFEDPYLMVLNKPYGMAVQGGSGTTHHIDGLLEAFTDAKGNRPSLVHRIDRDTSGLLLIAKNRKIAAELGEIFRSRKATKIYWAIVEGVPKPGQGRISLFLAKGAGMEGDRQSRGREKIAPHDAREKMRIAKHGEEGAQHSLTYYSTIERVAPRLSWVSLKPMTGRTHQLRAHMEAIDHPIIGDPKYHGDRARNDPRLTDPFREIPADVPRKLHLLARRLILPHPRGGMLDVTAPLPPHMKKTFDLFGFDIMQYDPILEAPNE